MYVRKGTGSHTHTKENCCLLRETIEYPFISLLYQPPPTLFSSSFSSPYSHISFLNFLSPYSSHPFNLSLFSYIPVFTSSLHSTFSSSSLSPLFLHSPSTFQTRDKVSGVGGALRNTRGKMTSGFLNTAPQQVV